MRDWGLPPKFIKSLRDTGGFTTFAQHISHIPASATKHPGFCINPVTNATAYCTDAGVEPYNFVVQSNNTVSSSPAGHTTPVGASYTRRRMSINSLAAVSSWDPVRNAGSHPPDGLLMKNLRTGYELPIVSIEHFSYHKDAKAYLTIDNAYSNSFINSKFLAGDGVEFYYAPATGKPVEDNLALTFVHGKAPEYSNSRMRAGMAGNNRRDGTVWVRASNIVNKNTFCCSCMVLTCFIVQTNLSFSSYFLIDYKLSKRCFSVTNVFQS